MTNKELYKTSEYDSWANRNGFLPQESYFLNKYLNDPNAAILEAGTGGGRIIYSLEEKGFANLFAFDYVEEMIERAKQKNQKSKIDFRVADAADLSIYPDNTFDTAIYLQQIISCLPHHLIESAFQEVHRVIRPTGIAIFSFLNYDGRMINRPLSSVLSILRRFYDNSSHIQQLPWLKLGGRINWKIFNDNQALNYWFTKNELLAIFEKIGMEILEVKTSSDFTGSRSEGMLYFVCRKKENP